MDEEFWDRARLAQIGIDKLTRSREFYTKVTRNEFLWKTRQFALDQDRRLNEMTQAKADLLNLTESNVELEQRVVDMTQYKNLGAVRDRIVMARIQKKIDAEHDITMQQIENPPYVTPEIIFMKLPELKDPPELIESRRCVDRLITLNQQDRDDIKRLKMELTRMKDERNRLEIDNMVKA